MTKTKYTLDALHRAEEAGLRIVVDASQWHSTDRRICPILPGVSPARCDIVSEARRLTDILENRPETPPEGVVYDPSTDRLASALALACAYIEEHMKEQADAKPSKDRAKRAQPHADARHDDADTGGKPAGDAGGKGHPDQGGKGAA